MGVDILVTTATLNLFKGCRYDLYRNMSNFSSLSAQNSYYNGLTKITKSVTFNKIGDPFILNDDIATLLEYTYGRIQYENKWWYFQVDDLAVNAQGQTVVRYTIDAWETMRYQYDIRLGAGQITRIATSLKDTYRAYLMGSPITPRVEFVKPISERGVGSSNIVPTIYGIFRDNNTDIPYYYVHTVVNSDLNKIANMHAVKDLTEDLKSDYSNITVLCAFYSTICVDVGDSTDWQRVSRVNATTWVNKNGTMSVLYATIQCNPSADVEYPTSTRVMSTPEKPVAICDERGNIVYRLADNVVYANYIDMYLSMSGTTCAWDCFIKIDNSNDKFGFSIPLEPLDIYTDSWAQYQSQQRQSDIDTRNLQMNTNLTSSLANIGASAGTGAVLGSVVPGIGTAIGALAGGVVGAVTSLTGYASSAYASPKEQEIKDNLYKKASDNVSLVGAGISGPVSRYYNSGTRMDNTIGFCKLRMSLEDLDFIEEYESVFGAMCNIPTSSCEDYIRTGPFQATCEVIGCPTTFGAQIQNRITNGVYFR